MKHDTKIIKSRGIVTIVSPLTNVSYHYNPDDQYISQYLSEENLSYYVAENNEDEEDEYLLNHALQESRKLCATFWTKNAEQICRVFNDSSRYNLFVGDTWKEEYKLVYVARKGKLSDYFDLEEIDAWYGSRNIPVNCAIFDPMFETEMIDLLSGKYKNPALQTTYSIFIMFEGDDVLRDYGPEGLIISGLLLGYPLEATADLIHQLSLYFIDNPRRI